MALPKVQEKQVHQRIRKGVVKVGQKGEWNAEVVVYFVCHSEWKSESKSM